MPPKITNNFFLILKSNGVLFLLKPLQWLIIALILNVIYKAQYGLSPELGSFCSVLLCCLWEPVISLILGYALYCSHPHPPRHSPLHVISLYPSFWSQLRHDILKRNFQRSLARWNSLLTSAHRNMSSTPIAYISVVISHFCVYDYFTYACFPHETLSSVRGKNSTCLC